MGHLMVLCLSKQTMQWSSAIFTGIFLNSAWLEQQTNKWKMRQLSAASASTSYASRVQRNLLLVPVRLVSVQQVGF